jgi:hypothetical protein
MGADSLLAAPAAWEENFEVQRRSAWLVDEPKPHVVPRPSDGRSTTSDVIFSSARVLMCRHYLNTAQLALL